MRLVVVLAYCLAAQAVGLTAAPPLANTIRIECTVRDRGGPVVDDLHQDDFRVLEDGVPKPVVRWWKTVGWIGRTSYRLEYQPRRERDARPDHKVAVIADRPALQIDCHPKLVR